MTNEDKIRGHWPIFEHWVLKETKALILPEKEELVIWWYKYIEAWNQPKEKHEVIEVMQPEAGEAPDD